jgi:hypothetical protein
MSTMGMKYRNRVMLLISLTMILAMLLPIFTLACEPMAPLKVKNETDITLSIYVNIYWGEPETYFVGNVAPGKEIENKNLDVIHFNPFPIIAKDAQGNVVYSDEYPVEQLLHAHWRIVITQADLKR